MITVVGLPAHAQTSPSPTTTAAPTTTPCPTELTIPGITVSCNDPDGLEQLFYLIDDTVAPCPTLVLGSQANFSIIIVLDLRRTISRRARISVLNQINQITAPTMLQFCDNPEPDLEDPRSIDVTAQSGAIWTAAITLSRDATSVTLSDIILTPQ